jgi:hypothetical protein
MNTTSKEQEGSVERQTMYGVSFEQAPGVLVRAERVGNEFHGYEPVLEIDMGEDGKAATAIPCSAERTQLFNESLGSGWTPKIEQWFRDFQSAYEHGMGLGRSRPADPYTGKYCVDLCRYENERKAFVIVQFGSEGSELRYEYEPLLALDVDNGAVLMRFNWSNVQDNGDDTWADVSAHRGPLGLFDNFETAYFYAQGLVKRAA